MVNDKKSAAVKIRAMVQKMVEECGLVLIAEQNDNNDQEQQWKDNDDQEQQWKDNQEPTGAAVAVLKAHPQRK